MRNRLFCGIAVLLAVFVATNLHAQDTGEITGTVRDNTRSGDSRSRRKNQRHRGRHRARDHHQLRWRLSGRRSAGRHLQPDHYARKGFKTFKGNGVVLRVGQKARVDATLAVGDIATEIVVQGEQLNQVETQTSELAGTVTGRQMTQLELNGRNYTQLLSLTPGATNQSGNDEPGGGLGYRGLQRQRGPHGIQQLGG